MTTNKKRSTASNWQSKTPTGAQDLELPSGNIALVRRMAPEAFLAGGMIPDPIMPIIQKAINSKKGLPPKEMDKLASDPKKLIAAMQMFDRVLVAAVIEPKVKLSPVCKQCRHLPTDEKHLDQTVEDFHSYEESEERDPDALYADVVDTEDKMFIFQWVIGGSGDIQSFRDQLAAGMDSVPTGDAVAVPAK